MNSVVCTVPSIVSQITTVGL